MSALLPNDREELERLVHLLPSEWQISLVYEYADGDALHLWAISSEFATRSEDEVGQVWWQAFSQLPLWLLARITLVLTQTPEEFFAMVGRTPDDLPEGAHRIPIEKAA